MPEMQNLLVTHPVVCHRYCRDVAYRRERATRDDVIAVVAPLMQEYLPQTITDNFVALWMLVYPNPQSDRSDHL